ncbi:hypothetical protein Leryth_018863 [Lithospermum erythrorhizon]|uniref:Phytocyanin domain-containing protein n=1 Tax=Lithospermum erythrorhizon TaxID=34254 RepID=A0AAV3QAR3_LITER|nr:hypothetical protein Leryth_018863 [Lithospermum erythrorhizon]
MASLVPRLVFVLFLLFSFSQAREFWLKGKHNSWKIPSSPDEFTNWARKLRFQIGDSIVMEYDSKSDSILEVNEQDYKDCNKANPIKSYQDGNTSINLNRSGWFYFISGGDGHCEKGQKLAIEVLNAKHAMSPTPSSEGFGGAPGPAPVATSKASDTLGLRMTTSGIFMACLWSFLVMVTSV